MPPNLEEDIKNCEWICTKIRDSEIYSQHLYAALCDMRYLKVENTKDVIFPILKEEYWSCSWRYSGRIIAEIAERNENYLDYYCSVDDNDNNPHEGTITEEIKEDLRKLGWIPVPWPN